MITLAGAMSLIIAILYIFGFMMSGDVNKVGGCIMILITIAFLGFAGFMTLIMMFG